MTNQHYFIRIPCITRHFQRGIAVRSQNPETTTKRDQRERMMITYLLGIPENIKHNPVPIFHDRRSSSFLAFQNEFLPATSNSPPPYCLGKRKSKKLVNSRCKDKETKKKSGA
jgi:hypothetical protein